MVKIDCKTFSGHVMTVMDAPIFGAKFLVIDDYELKPDTFVVGEFKNDKNSRVVLQVGLEYYNKELSEKLKDL